MMTLYMCLVNADADVEIEIEMVTMAPLVVEGPQR
jgi:hypothetical protein